MDHDTRDCGSGDRAAVSRIEKRDRAREADRSHGVRLEGFEPPTRGLGMRVGSFVLVLVCSKIPLSKPNFRKRCCSSFIGVCGGLVYRLVYIRDFRYH